MVFRNRFLILKTRVKHLFDTTVISFDDSKPTPPGSWAGKTKQTSHVSFMFHYPSQLSHSWGSGTLALSWKAVFYRLLSQIIAVSQLVAFCRKSSRGDFKIFQFVSESFKTARGVSESFQFVSRKFPIPAGRRESIQKVYKMFPALEGHRKVGGSENLEVDHLCPAPVAHQQNLHPPVPKGLRNSLSK
jgi:hypothetical protein